MNTLLLLLSLLSLTSASPNTSLLQDRICETTTGSPLAADVIAAGKAIANRPPSAFCCQENTVGTYCTTLGRSGTAAIGICGDRHCIACSRIGQMASDLASRCAWRDPAVNKVKAGGYFGGVDDLNVKITIFHS